MNRFIVLIVALSMLSACQIESGNRLEPSLTTSQIRQTRIAGSPVGDKRDGFYTVGDEIAPGLWRSEGVSDGCYWARLDANQAIIANHAGLSGGTVNVQQGDHEVEFSGCGRWVYIGGSTQSLASTAGADKQSGFYTVGVEIQPGRWRSTGAGGGCYWARLDRNQDIIDNHFGQAGGTVTVQSTDYEIHFKDCGVWEFQR